MVFLNARSTLLLFLVACLSPLFGALPSTTVWEIRTAGSANNGGCFDSAKAGTDFTQQNAAQYTFTDLVLATATTATSASHSFVAADVGNCIHITAGTGFTQGFYEITSASGGTATLDRSAGTGGSTGGTYAVGGAVIDPVTVNSNAQPGNHMYMKADGTYTFTSTMTVTNQDARSLTPYQWTGYTTTRTDGGRVTWTTATNSTPLISYSGTNINILFENITATNTASTRDDFMKAGTTGFNVTLQNLSMGGFKYCVDDNSNNFQPLMLNNIECKNATTGGIRNGSSTYIFDSYIHDNTGDCIGMPSLAGSGGNTAIVIVHSIIKSCTGIGLNIPNNTVNGSFVTPVLVNSVIMSMGSDGFKNAASSNNGGLISENTVIYNNTGNGLNCSANLCNMVTYARNNAFGSNTGGNKTNVTTTNDIALTVDPFVASGSNNFAPNNTAGGGASLRGAGYPGVLAIGGTGYLSIGALQEQAAAGAGVTTSAGFAQ